MADQTPERWQCKNCGYFNDDKATTNCARCSSPQDRDPHITDPAPQDNLDKTTVTDVKAIAVASGIEGADKMKKADAIDAIRDIAAPPDATPTT